MDEALYFKEQQCEIRRNQVEMLESVLAEVRRDEEMGRVVRQGKSKDVSR